MRIENHGNPAENSDAGSITNRSVSETVSSPQQAVQIAARQATQDSTYQSAVSALVAQVNQLPEVRQEKVAALAQQLHQGTYDVSPSQTADALLSEATAAQAA